MKREFFQLDVHTIIRNTALDKLKGKHVFTVQIADENMMQPDHLHENPLQLLEQKDVYVLQDCLPPTGDEVRATDFSCGSLFHFMYGVLNNSMNNFTTTNSYNKLFEYQADGSPRSCLVQQNGNNVFKLVYEYKILWLLAK